MAETPIYTDVNSAIIERCKKGERKAFYELYNLYSKAMFNIALRMLNNTADAEEVLQDSFLKAFDKIASYDPKYAFGVWLKKLSLMVRWIFLKRKIVLVSLDEIQFAQEDDVDDKISYNVESVNKCVAQLPDGYRTILSLYVFEDHSHKEIAELLGISEGTSKSQYNRAKKKLIELLKNSK